LIEEFNPTKLSALRLHWGCQACGLQLKTYQLLIAALVISTVWLGINAWEAPPSSTLPSVDPSQIIYVLPPGAIPAITQPTFLSANQTDFASNSSVVGVNIAGDIRAYPIAILNWHEIIDDVVGGHPIAITYCPLCGTGIVYSRVVNGATLIFKVSGRLYKNDLVMYDTATGSYWTQAGGYSIAGQYAGTRLNVLPGFPMTLGDWEKLYPNTLVMAKPTTYGRDYSVDPYASYKASADTGLFPPTYVDNALQPKEYVVGVTIQNDSVAYPYAYLYNHGLAQDSVGGLPIIVVFNPQTAAVNVFNRKVGGQILTFSKMNGNLFFDDQTNSSWSLITGEALAGSMQGTNLTQVSFIAGFWFAWVDFHHTTRIFGFEGRIQQQVNPSTPSLLNRFFQIAPFLMFGVSILGLGYLGVKHTKWPARRIGKEIAHHHSNGRASSERGASPTLKLE
jgi:uncharacterized protein DUF3179